MKTPVPLNPERLQDTKRLKGAAVDCAEIKSRLVEAAEGDLPVDLERQLRRHVASCESCRTELDLVKRGVGVLRETIPSLAPRQAYLTRARMERLMAAHAGGAKIFRFFTYRDFVAAAAAAAILISAAFITVSLRPLREEPATGQPGLAQMPSLGDYYVPVVLAAAGRGEPANTLGRMSVIQKARTPWVGRPAGERPVGMDTPGVVVPVRHAFYDPEESPYWW
jgi:hypothetical protein